jgi:hypothetical protein
MLSFFLFMSENAAAEPTIRHQVLQDSKAAASKEKSTHDLT